MNILRFDMRAPGLPPSATRELYEAALDMAAWADAKGFDLIAVSEHHGTEDGFLSSPLPLLGCMVGRTRRVQLSVVALLLPLYEPVKLAEDLALLDIASGGRVSIVAGLGYRPEEYEMLGVDWDTRGRRLDESLDLILRAWSGEPCEWQGRKIRLSPIPLTQPLPPIRIGGTGRPGARRAARLDLPYQPSVNKPDVFEYYREECRRQGVEPVLLPPGAGEMVWVSQDPDRSWREIGPQLLHDATVYASWQPQGQLSAVHSDARTVEELRAEGKYLVLTPDECIERARRMGAFAATVLFPLCGGIPPKLAWQSLELFASEVMPKLP
jgi:alkanesulfonate monooxygenase SsuD/methylene tetrahydromethanopterin reductase-like flavin-dependent oxidoreductase (luciferase family)